MINNGFLLSYLNIHTVNVMLDLSEPLKWNEQQGSSFCQTMQHQSMMQMSLDKFQINLITFKHSINNTEILELVLDINNAKMQYPLVKMMEIFGIAFLCSVNLCNNLKFDLL